MIDNKTMNKICNYIKENPTCIFNYCDNGNFIIYKKRLTEKQQEKLGYVDMWDWDIDDYGEGYIPNIAKILQACAKKGIDISKIKIITV